MGYAYLVIGVVSICIMYNIKYIIRKEKNTNLAPIPRNK